MFLPSALDCAPGIQPMRSFYTINTVLSPPPSHRQSATSPANIYSTCRALQSLVTTNLTSPHATVKPSCAPPSLASPIALAPASHVHTKTSSQAPRSYKATNAPQLQTPPASRKRRRSETDDNSFPTSNEKRETSTPSTPKRQRLCPPTLPLGLERADFDALQEQAATIPIPCTPKAPLRRRRRQLNARSDRFEVSPSATAAVENADWCSPDDSALVSLILHKLRLRQSDWDDCAQKLAEGKDSIGERFKMLLGSGEVGLRRGSGRRSRRSVTKMEFGPPLTGAGR